MGLLDTILGGLFGLGGAYMSSRSAENAADVQAGAADRATQAQLDMYYRTRLDQAPWRKSGIRALNQLWMPGAQKGLMEKGPGRFIPSKEPGYQFGYQEFVEKPTLRLAAASGKLGSGATLKALSRYASDYASTKYDNFLDRYYKSLDPYFRMAGMGSNVAIAGGNQAVETGRGTALSTLAGGEGRAAGILGSAYPYANVLDQIGRGFMRSGMSNWGSQNQLASGGYNSDYAVGPGWGG